MHPLKGLLAILGQDGVARGRGGGGEESRTPFFVPGFPFSSFLSLALLDLLLLCSSLRVLLADDGLGHRRPILSRLVWKLVFFRRHNLLRWEEGVDIDQKHLVLI